MTDAAPETKVRLRQFHSVSKWYGPVIGLNDATLEIEPGITGLVGHNGAGKSTLIKLLTGQLRPSLGQVRVCGHDAWSAAAKRRIGYCPDVNAFYEEMSGRNFVSMIASIARVWSPSCGRPHGRVIDLGRHDRPRRPASGVVLERDATANQTRSSAGSRP